jgi:hypothetical protein
MVRNKANNKKLCAGGNVVMVGDGMTDMDVAPPAHAVIGFGGNLVREAVCLSFAQVNQPFFYQVVAKAGCFVPSFDELICELDKDN